MSRASGITDDDELWLMLLGAIAVMVMLMNIDPIWSVASTWLVEHHLLTATDILVPLPGGVGLDLPRTALLAAALLVVILTVRFVLHRVGAAKAQRVLAAARERGVR